MNDKKKYHYYESLDGTIYRGVVVGFHMETGEQLIALRRVTDGTVWFLPKAELNSIVLINGTPTHKYQERFDIDTDNDLRIAPNPYVASRFKDQEYTGSPEKLRANMRDFEDDNANNYLMQDYTGRGHGDIIRDLRARDNYKQSRTPYSDIVTRTTPRHPNRGR